jgi:hypothetical protein
LASFVQASPPAANQSISKSVNEFLISASHLLNFPLAEKLASFDILFPVSCLLYSGFKLASFVQACPPAANQSMSKRVNEFLISSSYPLIFSSALPDWVRLSGCVQYPVLSCYPVENIHFSIGTKNIRPSINRRNVAYLIEKYAENEGAIFS